MNGFERARWIWHSGCTGANTYADFQTEFPGGAGGYGLHISADGAYALWVNGQPAGFGLGGDYEDLKLWDRWDITPWVREGANRVQITVHHPGADSFTYRNAAPGLLFEVFRDEESVAASGASVQTRVNTCFEAGPAVENITPQLGVGYHYDSTCAPAPWVLAVLADKPMPRYRNMSPVRTGELLPMDVIARGSFTDTVQDKTPAYRMHRAALRFDAPYRRFRLPRAEGLPLQAADGTGVMVLLDAGAEQTGHLRLELDVAEACDVVIGWGEHLEDQRVRTEVGRRNFAVVYRAHPGRNVFENPLRRLGFRYMQVHVYAPACTLYYVGAVPQWVHQPEIRQFRCADALHNRIYDACIRTLRLCMHEHYEDCPWREQAQYTMDSRNQMLCGYYALGNRAFPRKALRLMGHSIRPDHFLCICSPAGSTSMIPSFSAIYPVQLQEYLVCTGDRDFIREMLPTARRIVNEFTRRIDGDGVLSGITEEQAWNFYEWEEGLQGRQNGKYPAYHQQDAVLCGFVLLALRSMTIMCEAVGEAEEAAQYRGQYDALRENVHRVFFDEGKGVYASFIDNGEKHHYAELTQALLVYAGAVPEHHQSGVLARLTDGSLIPVTLSHSIYKYEALLTQPETYGRWVFADVADKWGRMLMQGATTFWETADGAVAFNNAGSLCHGWSAVPVVLYMKYALEGDPRCTGLYECSTQLRDDAYGR